MSQRSNALADRLEQGARALAELAAGLSDVEWHTRIPKDGRKIGVVVHHVGSMYPLEMQLTQVLAAGQAIENVTWDDIHAVNAKHAKDFETVTKAAALEHLERNSTAAAAAIRALSDEQLDLAAPVSLYGGAPLTCQFFIEDHAMRHSWYHTGRIREALAAAQTAGATA